MVLVQVRNRLCHCRPRRIRQHGIPDRRTQGLGDCDGDLVDRRRVHGDAMVGLGTGQRRAMTRNNRSARTVTHPRPTASMRNRGHAAAGPVRGRADRRRAPRRSGCDQAAASSCSVRPKARSGAGAGAFQLHRIISVPERLGERLQQIRRSAAAGSVKWSGPSAGGSPRPGAAWASRSCADSACRKASYGSNRALVQHGARAVRIVERQHRRFHEHVGGAEAARMLRIAFDLDRAPIDRSHDDATPIPDSVSVVANFKGSPGTMRSGIVT